VGDGTAVPFRAAGSATITPHMKRLTPFTTAATVLALLCFCSPAQADTEARTPADLTTGQSVTVTIDSHEKWNHTGIHLDRGQRYRFVAKGVWCDLYKPVNANGYDSLLFTPVEKNLRGKEWNWFALIGCVGENPDSIFLIGRK